MTESARILQLLDAASQLGAHAQLTLYVDEFGPGVAERTVRLWADVQKLKLTDQYVSRDDGKEFRVLRTSPRTRRPGISLLWPALALVPPAEADMADPIFEQLMVRT